MRDAGQTGKTKHRTYKIMDKTEHGASTTDEQTWSNEVSKRTSNAASGFSRRSSLGDVERRLCAGQDHSHHGHTIHVVGDGLGLNDSLMHPARALLCLELFNRVEELEHGRARVRRVGMSVRSHGGVVCER